MRRFLRSMRARFATLGIAALLGTLFVASAVALSGCQAGEQYPSKPILFVVPYAPGGGSDIMVRNLDKIAMDVKAIPQNFVIENKAGAGGVTGKSYAKEKPADGYTIFVNDESSAYSDLMGNAPWPYNEFSFISKMVSDYNMIIVTADSPIKTLKDFIDIGRSKPKTLNVAGTGIGNTDQVQLALFEKESGGKYTYVSFESGGQVMTNVLGKQVDAALANPSEAYEQMRAGKVRALGITSAERIAFNDPMFKDIPTWKENGVNLVLAQWRGISGPPKMKKEQQDWLVAAMKKVAESKQWKDEYLDKFQQMNAFMGGDEFAKQVDKEYEQFKGVFAELGMLKKK